VPLVGCIARIIEVVYSWANVRSGGGDSSHCIGKEHIMSPTYVPDSNAHGPPPPPYCSPDVTCTAGPTCVTAIISPLEHLGYWETGDRSFSHINLWKLITHSPVVDHSFPYVLHPHHLSTMLLTISPAH
jgi:hypothetical protein